MLLMMLCTEQFICEILHKHRFKIIKVLLEYVMLWPTSNGTGLQIIKTD